jgi:hypothetical protein
MGVVRGAWTVCFLVLACSSPDPGVEGLTRAHTDGGSTPPPDSGQSGSDGSIPTDTGAPTDTGSDMGMSMATAFSGEGAFAGNQPTTTAVSYHTTNNVGVTPGLGQDCLTCHKNGGPGVEFLFGGTVFQDMGGTMPAVDKEVRVYDSNNVGYAAYSDADGNFWFKKVATEIAFPALSGVRDGTNTTLMTGNITAANCNGCHDNNTTQPLHLP